jgi:DNA-binding response OmpR family regulator
VQDKILAIDDNPKLIEMLQLCLEREGYKVIVAYSGSEGLRKFQDSHPNLVILDIMMPDMDGWEICRSLREMSPHVPILILTVLKEKASVVRGLALGADGFLAKPFRPGELVARIQALLRRAKMTKASSNRPSYADETHYVKLYIRYLRQKIEESPKRPKYVLTEWGVGYRFQAPRLVEVML